MDTQMVGIINNMSEKELDKFIFGCEHGCITKDSRPCQQTCTGMDGTCECYVSPEDAKEYISLAKSRLYDMAKMVSVVWKTSNPAIPETKVTGDKGMWELLLSVVKDYNWACSNNDWGPYMDEDKLDKFIKSNFPDD